MKDRYYWTLEPNSELASPKAATIKKILPSRTAILLL